jgi:hypothetical protein
MSSNDNATNKGFHERGLQAMRAISAVVHVDCE